MRCLLADTLLLFIDILRQFFDKHMCFLSKFSRHQEKQWIIKKRG